MTEDEAHTPLDSMEERKVREEWVTTGAGHCPRCGTRMRERAIGGGSFGLGYHRRRVWLLCPSCRSSVLFDAARGTRT